MRLLITILFLTLTAWFALGSGSGEIPPGVRANISPEQIDRQAARDVMGDPPQILMGGQTMSCDSCHGIFESGLEEADVRNQHTEIQLEHGINARCYNCHSRRNRDFLVLPGEKEIGFSDVQQLCASCHGPTYRDWAKGIHGKSRGSWDMSSPKRRLMTCTECHDPHHPAMRPMAPLPAPKTLRKGEPKSDPHPHVERNPLRKGYVPATSAAQKH